MNKEEAELFDFLKKANLQRYFEDMKGQFVTVPKLVKYNAEMMSRLVEKINLPVGHEADLRDLIRDYNTSLEQGQGEIPSSSTQRTLLNNAEVFEWNDDMDKSLSIGKSDK